ncbi:tannase/feruloyl esterase family alpha/beta hydrolase [Paraburkholderia silvatlantica]|uniref:Feruloyl esterase n=1 Tax=Paraburkholderia silvatlantica TaxID=321895 RepID=A0A2U1AMG4_9BURK|nr:tannase/feruloyl esterase family alpha/beta hydrolase [Paraburkholderia silvatlantica]MBB2926776.1 feruloyl esterase [Paraburkholderia silvatlantica]PVY37596.1 feruloyl esterase [Paraburkholderia silvatlantica]PXW42558.1 feruloyl esterase [Paraburkholderia silvatlantica]PYE24843.1 feruloyl esterase [Paraburkholderia silvatlantica]
MIRRGKRTHGSLRAIALATLTLIAGSPAFAQHTPSLPLHCVDLAGALLPPASIGLPTNGALVLSAAMIPATATGNLNGDFCRLTGVIRAQSAGTPDIRFEVNLPSRWNGRALQFGGGGYSGVVVTGTGPMPFSPDRAPLARGYATFGDDSGHNGTSSEANFGLLEEAVTNFGYAHLKKAHDVALALITLGYGRLPEHVYFAGGSTGGREGYTVIQRYPDDYDGVIANSPALNFSGVRLIGVVTGQHEYRTPGGYLSPLLLEHVYERVLQVCDALDGAADGLISDVESCRAREPEIIDSLRCASQDQQDQTDRQHAADDCLTPPQIATLESLRDGLRLPYALAWNADTYRGYNVFQGTRFTSMLGLAHSPQRLTQPGFVTNGYLYAQGDAYLKYFITHDPTFDSTNFDVMHPGRYRERLFTLSTTIGAMNPDVSHYIARGGKLITLQGLADEVISPNQTIAYYQGLVGRYGEARVDSFMRLYMVPGYQHGNGVFIPSVDLLGALDDWVTHGSAPETLFVTDIAQATNGRTRPLCRYPAFVRYLGKGNLNRATSFTCVMPQ